MPFLSLFYFVCNNLLVYSSFKFIAMVSILISIFLGVGKEVLHQELVDIASDPSFVYSVKNFNSLYTVLKQLVHYDCDGNYISISASRSFQLILNQYCHGTL